MAFIDVSVHISNRVPVYPGDPAPEITVAHSISRGDAANVTALHFGAHTATHVDAPAHFLEGAQTVDKLPLDTLIGMARIVEIPVGADEITAAHVSVEVLQSARRVLFKTRNSAFWHSDPHRFRDDFTYISSAAAQSLVEQGVQLVGIDYLSIEKMNTEDFPAHRTLLSANVVIIEGLDLSRASAGTYELICLPLLISEATGDGAPARVVLRTPDGETR